MLFEERKDRETINKCFIVQCYAKLCDGSSTVRFCEGGYIQGAPYFPSYLKGFLVISFITNYSAASLDIL